MPNGDRIWLKPADGLKVRNPAAGGKHLPDAGAWATLNTFWRRRLKDGDVVEGREPKPAKPAAKKED